MIKNINIPNSEGRRVVPFANSHSVFTRNLLHANKSENLSIEPQSQQEPRDIRRKKTYVQFHFRDKLLLA